MIFCTYLLSHHIICRQLQQPFGFLLQFFHTLDIYKIHQVWLTTCHQAHYTLFFQFIEKLIWNFYIHKRKLLSRCWGQKNLDIVLFYLFIFLFLQRNSAPESDKMEFKWWISDDTKEGMVSCWIKKIQQNNLAAQHFIALYVDRQTWWRTV